MSRTQRSRTPPRQSGRTANDSRLMFRRARGGSSQCGRSCLRASVATLPQPAADQKVAGRRRAGPGPRRLTDPDGCRSSLFASRATPAARRLSADPPDRRDPQKQTSHSARPRHGRGPGRLRRRRPAGALRVIAVAPPPCPPCEPTVPSANPCGPAETMRRTVRIPSRKDAAEGSAACPRAGPVLILRLSAGPNPATGPR
jgi:hypothetical protein